MNTTNHNFALAAVLVAGALAGVGCGSSTSCKTESVALQSLPSCAAAAPGASVTVPLHVCPACYQSSPRCDVQIAGGTIFLDARAEACDDPSSCSTEPSCYAGAQCSFQAPAEVGGYYMQMYDPTTGQAESVSFTVSDGGLPSVTCT